MTGELQILSHSILLVDNVRILIIHQSLCNASEQFRNIHLILMRRFSSLRGAFVATFFVVFFFHIFVEVPTFSEYACVF